MKSKDGTPEFFVGLAKHEANAYCQEGARDAHDSRNYVDAYESKGSYHRILLYLGRGLQEGLTQCISVMKDCFTWAL